MPHQQHHDQLQLHDDHTVSVNHSSSSSSNNAPSEPSIDLSSWSPRSYRLDTNHKWRGKDSGSVGDSFLLSWLQKPPTSAKGDRPSLQQSNLHRQQLTLATKDPKPLRDSPYITPIYQIGLLSFLNPTHANLLLFLRLDGREYHALGAAQKNPMSSSLQAAPLLQPTPSMTLSLLHGSRSPTQMILMAYIAHSLQLLQSPHRPKNNTLLFHPAHALFSQLAQTHSQNFFRAHLEEFTPFPTPTRDPLLTLHIFCKSPRSSDTVYIAPPQSEIFYDPLHVQQHNQLTSNIKDTPQMTPLSSNHEAPTVTQISVQRGKKEKGKALPIRRSQRLQAKQRDSATLSQRPVRNKGHAKGIPFLPDNQDTPIDIEKAMQILQATGLEINQQIEGLIEETLKNGCNNEAVEQTVPTTPLHDPIPPRSILGFDLPL